MGAMEEVFDSCVRSAGDLAGVFEYDGETSYFYLYTTTQDAQKVLGAVHVLSGDPDFQQDDVSICWDASEQKVGLFIRGQLWAVFKSDGEKFGGDYTVDSTPRLPVRATGGFDVPQEP